MAVPWYCISARAISLLILKWKKRLFFFVVFVGLSVHCCYFVLGGFVGFCLFVLSFLVACFCFNFWGVFFCYPEVGQAAAVWSLSTLEQRDGCWSFSGQRVTLLCSREVKGALWRNSGTSPGRWERRWDRKRELGEWGVIHTCVVSFWKAAQQGDGWGQESRTVKNVVKTCVGWAGDGDPGFISHCCWLPATIRRENLILCGSVPLNLHQMAPKMVSGLIIKCSGVCIK